MPKRKTAGNNAYQKVLIAPSILAGNLDNLAAEARRVEKAGADFIHVDVMDGRFVARKVLGLKETQKLHKATRLALDVHLMVAEPWKKVEAYAKAGAKRICVHAEAGNASQILKTIKLIKKSGAKAGIAVKPQTPLNTIDTRIFEACDFIMPMTVTPGASGQPFMESALGHFDKVRSFLKNKRLQKEFEADGGINDTTARLAVKHGATVLVAGSAIFGALNAKAAIAKLRKSASSKIKAVRSIKVTRRQ